MQQPPPELELEPEPEPEPMMACAICFDEWADDDQERWPWSPVGCSHRYCSTCLTGFLSEKIATHQLDITCPGPRCAVAMEPWIVRRVLSSQSTKELAAPTAQAEGVAAPELLAKYETLLALAENARSASCPFCATVGMPDGRRSASIECSGCGLEFCAVHGDAHPGRSCKQFEKATRKATLANEKFIARTNKIAPCPRCGVNIEKNAGCLHMRCTQCNHNFCWCCGRDYTHRWHDGNIYLCPAELWGGDSWGPTQVWAARTLHVTLTPVALGLALTAASVALVASPVVLIGRKVQRRRQRAEQERYRATAGLVRVASTVAPEILHEEWPVFKHAHHGPFGTDWGKQECFTCAKQRGREDYRTSDISSVLAPVHGRHQRWLRRHCVVGASIEARYPPNGNYYPAQVSKVLGCLAAPDCYIEVEWDDGDHQHTVRPATEIRPRFEEAAALVIQQRWQESQRDPAHEAAAVLIQQSWRASRDLDGESHGASLVENPLRPGWSDPELAHLVQGQIEQVVGEAASRLATKDASRLTGSSLQATSG
eukprot:COSAG06_NODE_1781_length_8407_cov_9.719427_6_plen_541_part_00